MPKVYNRDNTTVLNTSPFEIIFRWNLKWMSMLVTPLIHLTQLRHFMVKLSDENVFFLCINDDKEWEEIGLGPTDKSEVIGRAIDYFYL